MYHIKEMVLILMKNILTLTGILVLHIIVIKVLLN